MRSTSLAIAIVATAVFIGPSLPAAPAETRHETPLSPLEGGRLQRMRLLLGGRGVDGPAVHGVTPLAGSRLREFRQLAQDVDGSARRAHARAKRELGDYPERGAQFLGELNYFAAQSRDLLGRANAARVDPQQIGPFVDRLLEDSRQADRRMRDARVFTSVWDDSGRTITILHRMASLVRS